jgi:hypothetical protein
MTVSFFHLLFSMLFLSFLWAKRRVVSGVAEYRQGVGAMHNTIIYIIPSFAKSILPIPQ